MSTRTYARDITTATTGASITIQKKGRIKVISINVVGAAAGILDVSTAGASQVTVADPGVSVLARCQHGVSPFVLMKLECDIPVEPFQPIFLWESGAGNGGSVNVVVQES